MNERQENPLIKLEISDLDPQVFIASFLGGRYLTDTERGKLIQKFQEIDTAFSGDIVQRDEDIIHGIREGRSFEEVVCSFSCMEGVSYSTSEGRYGFFDDGEGSDTNLTELQKIRVEYVTQKLLPIWIQLRTRTVR